MVIERFIDQQQQQQQQHQNQQQHEQQSPILIKYSGDSTNISKKNTKILNFTFTLMNEVKTARSVDGNFVLGIYFNNIKYFN